jgi:hypothetical protein
MDGRGWSDIAYNFMICQHGYTFEGRGLNVVNGANGTNAANRSSHAVMCLAGQENLHTAAEKYEFRQCVSYIDDNTMAPDIAIGHRDHKSTECPGDERYQWIHAGMPTDGFIPQPPVVQENDMSTTAVYEQKDGSLRAVAIGPENVLYHFVGTTDPASLKTVGGSPLPGKWKSISAISTPHNADAKKEVIWGHGLDNKAYVLFWTPEGGWQGPFANEHAGLIAT